MGHQSKLVTDSIFEPCIEGHNPILFFLFFRVEMEQASEGSDDKILNVSNDNPISIDFKDINLTLNEKHILKDVSGSFQAGQ
jgi:hypothetical protein